MVIGLNSRSGYLHLSIISNCSDFIKPTTCMTTSVTTNYSFHHLGAVALQRSQAPQHSSRHHRARLFPHQFLGGSQRIIAQKVVDDLKPVMNPFRDILDRSEFSPINADGTLMCDAFPKAEDTKAQQHLPLDFGRKTSTVSVLNMIVEVSSANGELRNV